MNDFVPGRRHGFMPIELLVVIAIIALLIGLLFPEASAAASTWRLRNE